MEGLRNLTWLLLVAPVVFVLYLTFLILGITRLDLHIILVLLPLIPAIIVTWLALIVAFVDVSRRPKTEISDEARMVWILLLALLNVLALFPYWLFVIRGGRQTPVGSSEIDHAAQPVVDTPGPERDAP